MTERFQWTIIFVAMLAPAAVAASGKALDSKNCLAGSGRAADCDSDHYCSSSPLDRGCRHCRVIADHYCPNGTKMAADFPSCQAYCQRRHLEQLVDHLNETLRNLSSDNGDLRQSLVDSRQALHTTQGTRDKLKAALITVSTLAVGLLLWLARCWQKTKEDYDKLLTKYPHHVFTASPATESSWWKCCMFGRTFNAPIAVVDPETPSATTSFIPNSNSDGNLSDSGLQSLAASVVIRLGESDQVGNQEQSDSLREV